jgi:predicted  nucleic acid-binding Zn-ribbon protein
VEDPDNWEPNFYVAYFSGLNSLKSGNQGGAVRMSGRQVSILYEYRSGISSCISSIHSCLDSVFSLIEDMTDYDKQHEAAVTVEGSVKIAAQYLLDEVEAEHSRMKREIAHYASEGNNDNVIYSGLDKIAGGRKNDYVRSEYIQKISAMTSLVDHRKKQLERVIANRRRADAEAEAAESKQRIEEYWEARQDEKAALESEKKSLLEKVAALNEEIPAIQKANGYDEMLGLAKQAEGLAAEIALINIAAKVVNLTRKIEQLNVSKKGLDPIGIKRIEEQIAATQKEIASVKECASATEIMACNQKIEKLNADKKALGLFNPKGKKEIDDQIAVIQSEIASIQKRKIADIQAQIDATNNEIRQIQARIDENTKPTKDSIAEHKMRIAEIDAELTAPR